MVELRPSAGVYVSIPVPQGDGWTWKRMGSGEPMAVEPVYSCSEVCLVLKAYGRVVSWLMARQHQPRFRLELQGITTGLVVGLHTFTPDASGTPSANGNPWVWLPPFEELPEYIQREYTEGRYPPCCEEKRPVAGKPKALPTWDLRLAVTAPAAPLYAPLPPAE